mmetsp:Transcript_18390/g.63327  ORF Transcript_18390/g.63327 Transcript_18390/m.63327 type:complete len:227 (+) Transcript_18390:491-1171(+)
MRERHPPADPVPRRLASNADPEPRQRGRGRRRQVARKLLRVHHAAHRAAGGAALGGGLRELEGDHAVGHEPALRLPDLQARARPARRPGDYGRPRRGPRPTLRRPLRGCQGRTTRGHRPRRRALRQGDGQDRQGLETRRRLRLPADFEGPGASPRGSAGGERAVQVAAGEVRGHQGGAPRHRARDAAIIQVERQHAGRRDSPGPHLRQRRRPSRPLPSRARRVHDD